MFELNIDLYGSVVFVTGCSRGIGKSIAIGLAKAGCGVIGVSKSMPLGPSSLMEEIQETGKKFYPYQCDFSDRQDIYRTMTSDQLRKQFLASDLVKADQINLVYPG